VERNESEFRLAEKWPKRQLERSRRELIDTEQRHRMNTHGAGDFYNSELAPEHVATWIAEYFKLPRASGPDRRQ
jgi:hypothetical protein